MGGDTNEQDVKKSIRDYLEAKGYEVQYIMPERGNRHSKGVADVAAMKNGITTWIEVKKVGGIQDDWQKRFEEKCRRAGVAYILAFSVSDVEHME